MLNPYTTTVVVTDVEVRFDLDATLTLVTYLPSDMRLAFSALQETHPV